MLKKVSINACLLQIHSQKTSAFLRLVRAWKHQDSLWRFALIKSSKVFKKYPQIYRSSVKKWWWPFSIVRLYRTFKYKQCLRRVPTAFSVLIINSIAWNKILQIRPGPSQIAGSLGIWSSCLPHGGLGNSQLEEMTLLWLIYGIDTIFWRLIWNAMVDIINWLK